MLCNSSIRIDSRLHNSRPRLPCISAAFEKRANIISAPFGVIFDNTVRVWDLNNGNIIATFTADAPLRACVVSPDGKTIVDVDEWRQVHFLRLESDP